MTEPAVEPEPFEEITPPDEAELTELENTETDYSEPVDVDIPGMDDEDDDDLEESEEDDEVTEDNFEDWLPTEDGDDWEIEGDGDVLTEKSQKEYDEPPPDPQPGYTEGEI